MKNASTLLAATLTLAALGTTAAPARAVDILSAWPGNWSCVSSESDKPDQHYALTAARYGTWVRFSGSQPAHGSKPARSWAMLVTYSSSAKKWFINSYNSSGNVILSDSTAARDAKRQTWNNIYPVNPDMDPGTIVMTDSSFETFDSWTERGKRFSAHSLCKKT